MDSSTANTLSADPPLACPSGRGGPPPLAPSAGRQRTWLLPGIWGRSHTDYQKLKKTVLQDDFLFCQMSVARSLQPCGRNDAARTRGQSRRDRAARRARSAQARPADSRRVFGGRPQFAACLGGRPQRLYRAAGARHLSYLNGSALIEAARGTGCDAVYPGYGFLSEKSAFAAAAARRVSFLLARAPKLLASWATRWKRAALPNAMAFRSCRARTEGFTEATVAAEVAAEIGFPLLLKAAGGGGGRGMRVVAATIENSPRNSCRPRRKRTSAFGNPEIYLERFFLRVRHIEIQVFGDSTAM